ncbi:MAG: hypothetical protein PUC88_02505 [Clostridia bacterium]|nr:hypothetical protein [Clostridia bacterium]
MPDIHKQTYYLQKINVYAVILSSEHSKWFLRKSENGELMPGGIAVKEAVELYKSCFTDVKISKYMITSNQVIAFLNVTGELIDRKRHILHSAPYGVHAMIRILKRYVVNRTGLNLWSNHNRIIYIHSDKDYNNFLDSIKESVNK